MRNGLSHLLDRLVDPSLGDEHECGGKDRLEELGEETSIQASRCFSYSRTMAKVR